jgi:hypothetical protein
MVPELIAWRSEEIIDISWPPPNIEKIRRKLMFLRFCKVRSCDKKGG